MNPVQYIVPLSLVFVDTPEDRPVVTAGLKPAEPDQEFLGEIICVDLGQN